MNLHYNYDVNNSTAFFFNINSEKVKWDDENYIEWELFFQTGETGRVFGANIDRMTDYWRKIQAEDYLKQPVPYDGSYLIKEYKFPNTWNRRYCFLHASFVTGTSFQYLGRSGDFYPKPSKMYQFTGNSTDFTLAVSFDGKQPVNTNEITFIVELAYIYSTGEYMAE